MSKIVRIHTHGGSEVMVFEELPDTQPGKGEVRLRIQAIGLNRSDILFRRGFYTPHKRHMKNQQSTSVVFPSRIGAEATGIVEAIGAGVDTNAIQMGDHVVTLPTLSQTQYGVYGESAIVPASLLMKYPDTLSPEQGAAIATSYLTAYGALVDCGRVRADEYVLVTAASSSVGLAALQILKQQHAKSIVTTRTSAKKQTLLDAGADHVIVTDDEQLVQRVLEITEGAGVRLIFDAVGGPQLEALAECAAENGNIIEYGAFDRRTAPYPFLPVLWKNLTIRGWTIYNFVEEADQLAVEQAKQYLYEGLRSGTLKPLIDRIFPFEQIAAAHDYLEASNQMGKVVVKVQQ